jgi:ankyrin repeat protein
MFYSILVTLLQTDAEVNSTLFRHVQDGVEEAMCLLLANGAKVDVTNEFGSTLLIYAVIRAKEGVVRLLLEKGAKVDAANNVG